MSNRKFFGNANGKGYYIALVLCAVAIGISGYLYYRNANSEGNPAREDAAVVATSPRQQADVPAVATRPAPAETTGTVPTQPAKQPRMTVSPVEGEAVYGYSVDTLSYNQTTRDWRVHNGVDIAAEEGTPVFAAADGEVYTVYEDDTMGMTVVIRHDDGYVTKYASLAEDVAVTPGMTVQAGDTIGTVGNTALLESSLGSHLHFAVSCDGADVDPAEFLNQQ